MNDFFKGFLSRELVTLAVMLAVLSARWLLQKAPKRLTVLLWAVVCFRLLCPVTIDASVSLVPKAAEQAASAVESLPEPRALSGLRQEFSAPYTPDNNNNAYSARQWGRFALALAPYVWLAGMAALTLSQLKKLLRLRKTLRGAQELAPGVYTSENLPCAFVLGLFCPNIYLPAGLSEQEQRYVLLHERTHIKRLDHIWKLLALLCLCIHWFDPVVWLCWVLFGRDLELACDEASTLALSTSERCDYAETLLHLSGDNSAFPLPAFSQPEPETRIRRVLSWKRPARSVCALALILVILLGAGLLVDPASKDDIFSQRYRVRACLYDAPQFDFTYTTGSYPAFALSETRMLYIREADASFNECGGLREISVSKQKLLSLFDEDSLSADARRQLTRVKACYLADVPDAPFYLVMKSGKSVLLAVGYGDYETEQAGVRWLFALKPDAAFYTTQDLTALIRKSSNLTDREIIQIYSVYESESLPGLIFAAYDGAKNGVAVFSYDSAIPGYYIRMLTTSNEQDTFYSETSTWYDLGKSWSIITSHHRNAAEVRASWNGVALTAPVASCPAMVILEWPDASPLRPDSEPDIRFYDPAGEELPRE